MSQAQNVFNPADPIVRWNSSATLGTATNPDPGIAGLQKWVSVASNGISTGTGSWDVTSYKAYFINIGGAQMCFRLKFPKSYTNPDSAAKKYPLMVFFHGAGEPGCTSNGGVYNNERQLTHGGKLFKDRVDNNSYDGFLFYPQVNAGTSCSSTWGVAPYSNYYNLVLRTLDSLVKYARMDNDRVFVDGLSNGGATAWSMTATYPQRVASVAPSAAATGSTNYSDFVHIPIWFATGGKDSNPNPAFAQSVYDGLKNAGANIRYTLYPDQGHSVWTSHWSEPDFLPFMNAAHKANPLIFFGRDEFCPGDPINVKIGVTDGFYAYEWQKDGVTIATTTNTTVDNIVDGTSIISYVGNEISVNSFGTYRVRFKRTASSDWSVWSPKPAVIRSKPVTQTPDIQVNGLKSKVLPAPDGSSSVSLKLPEGYVSYQWLQGATVVGTQSTYSASSGTYTAKVVEQFGCGALPSNPFTVINAAGNPKPEPAKNLSAAAVSLTSIQLDWSDNPNAGENETGFEIYRSTNPGGPYQLVTITTPNVITYINTGLTANTQYYFIVRAVGASGAAVVSNEAAAKTEVDNTAPSAPTNLKVLSTFSNYVNLSWTASTDNVGVDKYDIFLNGVKTYTTTETSFTAANLDSNKLYTITVKARDAVGNLSVASNQVTINTGLVSNTIGYKYYEGTWSNLPNFTTLTPVKIGTSPNVDISLKNRNDNFGFLWEGYINVPTTSTYTFEICSDDGSKLYIDQAYGFSNTALINHDGTHGATCKTASVALTAGMHPIALAYFQSGSGSSMTWSWQNTNGLSKQAIPSSVLYSPGIVPPSMVAPSSLVATAVSHAKINLTWTDNSSNESGFEILRSTSPTGTYAQVATVPGTSYTDSGLLANTKYFYKIRAIGLSGESIYESNYTEANWKVNNSNADANGNATRTLTLTGATYSTSGPKEGTHALSLSGNNQYATVNGSSSGGFPSDGAYDQRTIAMWIKPSSTNNSRVIFDFGNNVNGIALRFNGGVLQAGISSGTSSGTAVRGLATATSTAFNNNWISGGWNHVAVVYNVNSLKVFLNGVEIAANNSLGITSIVAAASNNSRIGYSGSASDNAFNVSAGSNDYFAGQIDDIYVVNGAMIAEEVGRFVNATYAPSSDTTLATPSAPATPTALAATPVSATTVNLVWNDNASDETGYEIWRSASNNTNYRVVGTVPAGALAQAAYSDTTLFANVTYYYKVRAKGIASPSAFSNEISVVTPNTVPAFAYINDFTIRYSTTHTLTVVANDPDGDPLTFTAGPLPQFVFAQNPTANSIDIVSVPAIGDQGSYGITVYVQDSHGGKDTIIYNMEVNSNNLPVISPVANVNMNEGETRSIALVANDDDDNSTLVWTAIEKPSFATLVDSGNGRGSVTLAPNLAAGGSYTMTLKADDGSGGWVTKTITIDVAEKDPNETIQVNMKYYTPGGAGWNDVETANGGAFNTANLKNTKGVTTTAGISLLSGTYGASDAGVQGGGVFPNNVMKDGIFWGFYWQGGAAADTLRLKVYGLDATKKYNFIFMGSNNCTFCGTEATSTTTYKIGNETAVIPFYMNANITDTIYQVQPAANGDVIITMIGDANAGVGGTLNALVIDAQYDDGTTPAKPANLLAEAVAGVGVKLNWTDKSYNEYAYKVYRAATKPGPYTLVSTLDVDANTYTDEAVAPFTQYYYYVTGVNNHGVGASSDSVAVTTANNKPVIAGLTTSLALKTDGNNQNNFTVTDTPGDIVTVSIVNKPGFVTLQSLGGNNYRLTAVPTASDLGNTTFTVKATDDKGATVTSDVTIAVSDKNTRSVYLNFGNYGDVADAPWNNIIGYGNAGTTLNNLVDENNAATAIGFQLVNGWSGISPIGHQTGNNSGVYNDMVLKSGLWDNNNTARTIRFTGLDNSKRYNVVIVGTQNEGLDASARYVAGSEVDTLNARYNTNQTANLNNLTPASGVITVDMSRVPGATYMFMTAVQLEEFTPGLNLNPVNMYVEPKDRNSAILSWSDRTNNETGFQLERATDAAFATAVQINLPANTTTYTSASLIPNTKYWYRVRAKIGGTYTDWSNTGKTITPSAITYVNFNFATEYNASSPWYNLAAMPTQNFSFSNLPNQSNQPTGITLSIEKVMNGDNNFGVITGNNSGIAPDVVLQSNYWIDNTQQSQMKLTGLNQSKRYRIGFLGSMSTNGWFAGNYTCTYTINGRTVYLNSWMNSTKIVFIGDVQADANGELLLDFSTTQEAVYGFNGGLVIEAYDDVPEGGSVLNRGITNPTTGNSTATVADDVATRANSQVTGREVTEGRMYPNPFIDQISLDFNNTAADNHVSVDVYDLSGKLMFRKAFGKLSAGYNTLRVNTGSANLNAGIYMITLNVNGKPVQVSKMVKANQ
jgi:dienelactone hydrolase